MRIFHRRFVLRAGLVALILIVLWAIVIGPEPPARITVSPDELVRAVTIQREALVDLCLMERVDPNGRDGQGRTPLLIATSQQDWKTARRLLDAGAAVDLADKNGFTPVMAAAMHGDLEMFQLLLARSTNLHPEKPCTDGQDLLSFALDGGHQEIIKTVVQRLPMMREWTASTRRALSRVSFQHTVELRSGPQHGSAVALRQRFSGDPPKRIAQLHRRRSQRNYADARLGSGPCRLFARSYRRRSKPDAPNDPEQNVGIGCRRGDWALALRTNPSRRRSGPG